MDCPAAERLIQFTSGTFTGTVNGDTMTGTITETYRIATGGGGFAPVSTMTVSLSFRITFLI